MSTNLIVSNQQGKFINKFVFDKNSPVHLTAQDNTIYFLEKTAEQLQLEGFRIQQVDNDLYAFLGEETNPVLIIEKYYGSVDNQILLLASDGSYIPYPSGELGAAYADTPMLAAEVSEAASSASIFGSAAAAKWAVPFLGLASVAALNATDKDKVASVGHAPEDLTLSLNTIRENQAGAVVGKVSVVDRDAGDTHSYTVSDSRFE
ncbi:hypothetical protein, partial [Neisseria weixii]|uniref:hypothetical protein n=1 Tax=Neisseria weixii TaxID=1853276 RepID=UPI00359FFFC1